MENITKQKLETMLRFYMAPIRSSSNLNFFVDLSFSDKVLPEKIIFEDGLQYFRYMDRFFSPIPVRELTTEQSVQLCELRLEHFRETVDLHKNIRSIDTMLSFVNSRTTKPKKILDFGCGNGVFTSLIQKRNPRIDVVGVDISSKAINQCKLLNSKIDWLLVEDSNLQIEDNSIDVILSSYVMHFNVEDKWLTELNRIIALDGEFVFNIFNSKYKNSNLFERLKKAGFIVEQKRLDAQSKSNELYFSAKKARRL